MDRSYLSDQAVVSASRAFVCVRLLTYESAEEAEVLKRLFVGRDGLENSVFAILDPTGTKTLTRSGRSPSWAFEDAAEMASSMRKIAKRYPGKENPPTVQLPWLADVRRGLNAARADSQLLMIVCGTGKKRDSLETELARLAWSDAWIGKFLYARADEETDWNVLEGSEAHPRLGVVLVQPGEFGTDGKVLASFDGTPTAADLAAVKAGHEAGPVDTRRLKQKGRRAGIEWKPAIPITDRRGSR
ncbi:MAG: hypothetical protein KDC95_06275 [Planctomycetes bacterium]|nr:hypothetical protein [Planctomycetota bacterium]